MLDVNKDMDRGSITDILKVKMPWADTVMVRSTPYGMGIEIRVVKGRYHNQMIIEDCDNPTILDACCDRMTYEFKDAIGQGVIDGNIRMLNENTIIPKEMVIEHEIPKFSIGDYILEKVDAVKEMFTGNKMKKKKHASILPSKREPNKKAVNGEADKYYDADGKEVKRKWYQIW